MTAVAGQGRRWMPQRSVAPGSIIELSDRALEEITRTEHTRWYRRRRAAGWSSGGPQHRTRASGPGRLINRRVVPWTELPERVRQEQIDYLRAQLARAPLSRAFAATRKGSCRWNSCSPRPAPVRPWGVAVLAAIPGG